MDKEHSNGLMDQPTQGDFQMEILKGKVNLNGKMAEHIQDNGKTIK